MSVKEFNERAKRHRLNPEPKNNSSMEMFDAFLAEMFHETYASDLLKSNPEAYQEQLNQFLDEHSL